MSIIKIYEQSSDKLIIIVPIEMSENKLEMDAQQYVIDMQNYGLSIILQYQFMQRRKSKTQIIAPAGIEDNINHHNTIKKNQSTSQSQSQVYSIYKSNFNDLKPQNNRNIILNSIQTKLQSSLTFTPTNQNTSNPKNNFTDDKLTQFQIAEKFIQCAEIGDQLSLNQMYILLKKDPKRFMYERNQKQHLINKINSKGYNSSYLAAKNGNLKVIQFLHKNQALFNLKILINNKFIDTPIQAANRWQHNETVLWMLQNIQFEVQILESIYLKSSCPKVRMKLSQKMNLGVKIKDFANRFCCCIL